MTQFTQLNTKSVADTVSEKIQHLILGGGLKPGEKLPSERNLAAEFSVSRMSLRQGIALLVDMGLLVVHKDGTYVCDVISPSLVEPFAHLFNWYPKALNDMLELRLLLETEAIELAIKRSCESDQKIIEFFFERMQTAFSDGEQQIMPAVNDFHMAIIDCSYNLALATVLRGILALLRSSYEQHPNISHLNEFQFIQERLYQAVISKDTAMAQKMVNRHIEILKSLYPTLDENKETNINGENTKEDTVNSLLLDKTISRIEHLLICGYYEAGKRMPSAKEIANEINESEETIETSLSLMEERSLLIKKSGQLFAVKREAQPLINDPLVHLMNTDTRIAYNVLELRILLERNSAFQASKNDNIDKRNHLKSCLNKLLTEEGEYNANNNSIDDYEFHLAIADMSENLAITYLMRSLFNLLRVSISSWLALFNKEVGDISIIQNQHIDVCDSILASKPEEASEAMRAHLQYVITTMQDIYARKEREMYAQQRWRYLGNKFNLK